MANTDKNQHPTTENLMKTIRVAILVFGMLFPLNLLHAQTIGSPVVATAEAQGLQPVSHIDLPRFATYWEVMPGGFTAPLPSPPSDPTLAVFAITDTTFLVDATGGQVLTDTASQAEATAVVNLINQVQSAEAAQQFHSMARAMGDVSSEDLTSDLLGYSFDTNQLWLEITNVSNGWSYLNLHNATNQVYAIWSTTDLLAPWNVETEVWPTDTNCMPFSLQNFDRQNLFLRAEDWTGVTENGNTTPDWWFWLYFGTTALSDTNLDANGNSLLSDYESGTDPNVMSFSISVTNDYVKNMSVPVQLNIMSGTPNYFAVSVDDTNYAADANWQAYAGINLAVNLGLTEGWHDVWIGLRGLPDNATQTWQYQRLKLLLVPPPLVITTPNNTNVNEPVVQITGYSPEALNVISYNLTNSAGVVQNQPVWILGQQYDTNNLEFTTNTFQAFDIALAHGLNVIQLKATDLAGNVATTNISLTLNYSNKPAPVLQLNWPQSSVAVCGAGFIGNGSVSDPTATLVAQLVDTNGNTNVVNVAVGRDGNFWAQSLPLIGGTNVLTLTITDVASNTVTTNITVIQGYLGLGIDSVSAGQAAVTGEINSSEYTVWVNGSQAVNNGDGTWAAQITPVGNGGGVVEAIAIPNSDNGGNGSGGSPDFAGNPRSAKAQGVQAVLSASQGVYIYSYHEDDTENYYIPPYTNSGGYVYPSYTYSDINFTHWDDGKGGNGQWVFHDDSGVKHTFTWPASSFPQSVPSGTGVEVYLDYPGIPPRTFVCNPPRLAKEHCGINVGKSPFMPTNMQCTADAKIKLATGGPAGSSKKNLWVLTPSATKYDFPWSIGSGDTWWHSLTGTSIPAQNISINGQTAEPDGNIYLLMEDNTSPDITPTIVNDNPKNYTFDVSPQEYIPTHVTECTAAGNPDNTRTTIGIGELVDFGGMPAGTIWSVSGQGSISSTTGSGTVLTAFMSPGSVTVTATIYNVSIQTTFSVVAPSGVQVADHYDNPQGWVSGTAEIGADTKYLLNILPTSVSFIKASMRENIPAHSLTWPDGVTDNLPAQIVPVGPGDCGDVFTDEIRDGLVTKYNIFNGTSFVDFSFSFSWPDEYKNQSGDWIQFTTISTQTKFSGSNLTGQQTYQGVSGAPIGPFQ
jgi:hypothetical protein